MARRARGELQVEAYRMVSGARQLYALVRYANWHDLSVHAYRLPARSPGNSLNASVSFDETRRVIVLQGSAEAGLRALVYREVAAHARGLAASASAAVRRLCDDVTREVTGPLVEVIMAPVSALAQQNDYHLADVQHFIR